MLNPIKEIAKWQKDAGNAAKPYDDFLESSFSNWRSSWRF